MASGTAQTSSSTRPKKPRHQAQASTNTAPPIAPPYQTSPVPQKSPPIGSSETWLQCWNAQYRRAPIRPPTSAAKTIS